MKQRTGKEQKIQLSGDTSQIPEIYTNAALSNFSPYEFELTLGLGSSNYEGVRPIANVRMSPQFAKEFARLLQENVRMFEESFGEIVTQEK